MKHGTISSNHPRPVMETWIRVYFPRRLAFRQGLRRSCLTLALELEIIEERGMFSSMFFIKVEGDEFGLAKVTAWLKEYWRAG